MGKQISTICPNARMIRTRHRYHYNREKVLLVPCNDWRKCDVCRQKRSRFYSARISNIVNSLDNLESGRYYPLLITATIDPKRYPNTGRRGRDILASGINRLGTMLRRTIDRPPLFRIRVYEHHKKGSWHCHILMALHSHTRLNLAKLRAAYGIGFLDFRSEFSPSRTKNHYKGGTKGLKYAILYISKYLSKVYTEYTEGYFTPKGTRVTAFTYTSKLKTIIQALGGLKYRGVPRYRSTYIGQLKERSRLWKSLLTHFGLSLSSYSLEPAELSRLCISIDRGNARISQVCS